jgi:hypothetical protein
MSHRLLPPLPIRPRTQSFERCSYEEAPPSYSASEPASTSLDISQRFERTLARYNASDSIWKRWLFEIVSWTTSAACMVSHSRLTLISYTQY